ncbi:hypothetical protein TraAM80_01057 [Trypanosoma rangeli]|uniref:Uncharacterized protein n=1 Tax=Trypanosoma rangeli TaxID=5698 RepID=A0A3R7NT77_TRYRA|nr:uncharacterized protein TraAM80_01057 [Trypanosoma rangeli]RNF11268.1 hypothetical protein TraAM80_01057 [Trypanosoma rangeli]|eukprot:RNF11268.1 hypothetical protein TraAM80_01057 [Trypanosoma rangeli]
MTHRDGASGASNLSGDVEKVPNDRTPPEANITRPKLPPLRLVCENTATELPESFLEIFPAMVRDVSLRGDICLPSVPPSQKDALFALAATHGSACSIVVDGEGMFHLRNGTFNPHLQGKLAEELHYLQGEGEQTPADAPVVLRWAFMDRCIHREVVTLLQILAYDMGIFCGERLFDGSYIYRVEVALRYLPHWEAERRKLIDPSLEGDSDPFPIPAAALQNTRVMDVYRSFIRPFLYDWNCKTTRCEVDIPREASGQVPKEVRLLGSSFSLRHEVSASGIVFFRRWTRHLVQVFSKYAGELRRQDSKGVQKTLARYGGDLDPVDTENMTPHFGLFICCLEARYYKTDLAELEEFARRSGYFVYVSMEGDLAMVLATARLRPALAEKYKPIFLHEGEEARRLSQAPPQGNAEHLGSAIHHTLLPQHTRTTGRYYDGNDKKVSHMDLIRSGEGGSSSSSSSSSNSSNSSSTGSGSDHDRRFTRKLKLDVQETRWSKGGSCAALGGEPERSAPKAAQLAALTSLTGNMKDDYWYSSLTASNLYGTIVGEKQCNLPPGWSVRRDFSGKPCILDHLRRRAYHRDSPMVSMEFAAGPRELFNVADSLM